MKEFLIHLRLKKQSRGGWFDKFSINKIFSEKSLESLKYLRENFNKLNLHDENQKNFLKTYDIN